MMNFFLCLLAISSSICLTSETPSNKQISPGNLFIFSDHHQQFKCRNPHLPTNNEQLLYKAPNNNAQSINNSRIVYDREKDAFYIQTTSLKNTISIPLEITKTQAQAFYKCFHSKSSNAVARDNDNVLYPITGIDIDSNQLGSLEPKFVSIFEQPNDFNHNACSIIHENATLQINQEGRCNGISYHKNNIEFFKSINADSMPLSELQLAQLCRLQQASKPFYLRTIDSTKKKETIFEITSIIGPNISYGYYSTIITCLRWGGALCVIAAAMYQYQNIFGFH